MSEPAIKVVCDSGPLIHLDELDCLSLLNDFSPVLVPKQVWQEVIRVRPDALSNVDWNLQITEVEILSTSVFQALVQSLSLDLGEQAALTLMEVYPQAIFLTDDAAARLAADTFGYRVHGSIGILVRAVRRQQRTRDEIITILNDLPSRSSLHIRQKLLQDIITKLT